MVSSDTVASSGDQRSAQMDADTGHKHDSSESEILNSILSFCCAAYQAGAALILTVRGRAAGVIKVIMIC